MILQLKTIGDISYINPESINKSYPFDEIIYIDISSVNSGIIESKNRIKLDVAPSRAKRIIKEGDSIIATVRPANRAFYHFKEPDENTIVSTGFAVLRAKDNTDRKYLYYLITDPRFTSYLVSIEQGANYPAVSQLDIKNTKVKIPPLPIQKKIAGILSAYDDLIENNLKRIKLLEEAAQNIYEEWFVRLRFPGHENTAINKETGLPIGWERKKIGDLIRHQIGGGWGQEKQTSDFRLPAYVIRGTDFDSIFIGKLNEVPYRFHKESNLASRKLENGDIIFEVSGGSTYEGVAKTLLIMEEVLTRFETDVMCASFCKLVRPLSIDYTFLLFHFLRFLRKNKVTEIFEIRSAGNIVNYNWTAFLKYQDVTIPDQKALGEFNQTILKIHELLIKLGNENQLLKEARDILLPRLMSGMIDVERMEVV